MKTLQKLNEETEKDLAEKITDYGFNDEYGYYSDWLDGASNIIKKAISSHTEKVLKVYMEEVRQQVVDLRNSKIDSSTKKDWNNALEQSARKLETLSNNFLKQ